LTLAARQTDRERDALAIALIFAVSSFWGWRCEFDRQHGEENLKRKSMSAAA
jgi:hypothetical protein